MKGRTPKELLAKKSKHVHATGCIEWTGFRTKRGYGVIGVNNRVIRAHRIAYEIAFGPIPRGLCVCHSCDNRACINPEHLFVATHAENMKDMADKGRANNAPAILAARGKHKLGENHHATKVTANVVTLMRDMKRGGNTLREVSARFGVPMATVQSIVTGRTWGHVPNAVEKKFERKRRGA